MREWRSLKPIGTVTGAGGGGSTHTTVAPTINIGTIDSQDTADYFAQRVAIELSMINDRKGR